MKNEITLDPIDFHVDLIKTQTAAAQCHSTTE